MRKILCLYILVFFGAGSLQGQHCDCPYPIVFVHGWAGSETSWQSFSNYIEPIYGDTIEIPSMVSDTGTVYYAHLNWDENSTNVYDDVVVHEQFSNAPELREDKKQDQGLLINFFYPK